MFRGEYKKLNSNGVRVKYITKDTVIYQGNIYECTSPTSDSPIQKKNKWNYTGSYVLFSSDSPPINPKIGQQWEKNGIIYTYYYDGNNYSWIQF